MLIEAKCLRDCWDSKAALYCRAGESYMIDPDSPVALIPGCWEFPQEIPKIMARPVKEAPRPKMKKCACGREYAPTSNNQRVCSECGAERKQAAARARLKRFREKSDEL